MAEDGWPVANPHTSTVTFSRDAYKSGCKKLGRSGNQGTARTKSCCKRSPCVYLSNCSFQIDLVLLSHTPPPPPHNLGGRAPQGRAPWLFFNSAPVFVNKERTKTAAPFQQQLLTFVSCTGLDGAPVFVSTYWTGDKTWCSVRCSEEGACCSSFPVLSHYRHKERTRTTTTTTAAAAAAGATGATASTTTTTTATTAKASTSTSTSTSITTITTTTRRSSLFTA